MHHRIDWQCAPLSLLFNSGHVWIARYNLCMGYTCIHGGHRPWPWLHVLTGWCECSIPQPLYPSSYFVTNGKPWISPSRWTVLHAYLASRVCVHPAFAPWTEEHSLMVQAVHMTHVHALHVLVCEAFMDEFLGGYNIEHQTFSCF